MINPFLENLQDEIERVENLKVHQYYFEKIIRAKRVYTYFIYEFQGLMEFRLIKIENQIEERKLVPCK